MEENELKASGRDTKYNHIMALLRGPLLRPELREMLRQEIQLSRGRICQHCGTAFSPKRLGPVKYCSQQCRDDSRPRKTTRTWPTDDGRYNRKLRIEQD